VSKCAKIDELEIKLESLTKEFEKLKHEKNVINTEKFILDQKLQKYQISFESLIKEFEKTSFCNFFLIIFNKYNFSPTKIIY